MIDRIKNLNDKQRAALIQRLGAKTANAHQQLVAYIVTRGEQLDAEAVRAFLKQRLPDYMIPASLVFLKEMPRLPNGKIDRSKLPDPSFSRTSTLQKQSDASEREKQLLKIWSDVLGVSELNVHDNFFEAGGDSILSMQIVARAKRAGFNITPAMLFQYPTVAELATVATTSQPQTPTTQTLLSGEVALTPIQLWFFEQGFEHIDHWNQAIVLETDRSLEMGRLERAFSQIIARHDALRLRFEKTPSGWKQIVVEARPITIERVSVSSDEEVRDVIDKLQSSLKIAAAATLRAVVLDDERSLWLRIVVVAHHLVIDTVSWSILLEELELVYENKNNPLDLTSSCQAWSLAVRESMAMPQVNERQYWLNQATRMHAAIPTDFSANANLEGSTQRVSFSLSSEETQALIDGLQSGYNARPHEALLCAVGVALGEWVDGDAALIGIEHHGREPLNAQIDLSRTIGWFTAYYPFLLSLKNADIGKRIAQTKDALRSVPRNGIGFGQLRYLDQAQTQAALDRIVHPQILFNYSGQFEQTLRSLIRFKRIDTMVPHSRNPNEHRAFSIEINSGIAQGQLQIEWIYSEGIHRAETIQRLGERLINALREIIVHCQSLESRKLTATDFTASGLNQSELDELLSELGG
jgi:non-ribosomal peptide synthase protein (TIGR01720 family)